MNPKELTTLLASVSNPKMFDELSITLKIMNEGDRILKGLSTINEFVYNQVIGWGEYEEIPPELVNSKNYYNNVQQIIDSYINNNIHRNDRIESEWVNLIRNGRFGYVNTSLLVSLTVEYYLFNDPEVYFLIDVYNEYNREISSSAYQFLTTKGRNTINLNFPDSLLGANLAYEFRTKDSLITNRRNKERRSLNDIKVELNNSINGSKESLNDFIAQSKEKVTQIAEELNQIRESELSKFNEWNSGCTTNYSTWYEDKTNEVQKLEALYGEKLRLSQPVKYWAERANKMNVRGYWFMGFLIGMIILSCLTLLFFILKAPQQLVSQIISGSADAIKWGLSSITVLSFLAYGIRSLNKLMFSSFHLARDAEEREQLTYVYLALYNEKKIDEKEKSIVLQALFSRADTGLLKEDSSPTMPGSILDKFTQK